MIKLGSSYDRTQKSSAITITITSGSFFSVGKSRPVHAPQSHLATSLTPSCKGKPFLSLSLLPDNKTKQNTHQSVSECDETCERERESIDAKQKKQHQTLAVALPITSPSSIAARKTSRWSLFATVDVAFTGKKSPEYDALGFSVSLPLFANSSNPKLQLVFVFFSLNLIGDLEWEMYVVPPHSRGSGSTSGSDDLRTYQSWKGSNVSMVTCHYYIIYILNF